MTKKKSPWSNGGNQPNRDRIAKEHRSKLKRFQDLFENPLKVVDIKQGVLVSRDPEPAYFRSYTPEEWKLIERIKMVQEEKILDEIKRAWEERKARRLKTRKRRAAG
ncbi:hypothetical protein SAMN02745885_01633 [Carboxydocella sporoproducens DSM 16521]|uniref:Uncharacterized protein n=2 Tax=Carboxydocella TaxID=178898 RepID=A0A1T4QEM0_9FIRM|nr:MULTISPECIES: hypothetical protein [Carboxydocella]AVX21618.1 hypothetical protein CFE_2475 [Carboxydocella thermautotrophica]SKA02086.1 hypothetical protein SAMN02745885_01633 [Carboxydocella sporoproducens DSM 16521]